ncbi:hypothetical protein EWM64_g7782 [Hericium alpestre]|uniref:Carboxypeptidase n=1 Tax=Hericium alpestre TaxID=135208 RepID=A0A4Y9ZRU5_9AGAM|nr:hypothetical protein EWM64_g7782 [Hericium alpestre]
MFSVLKLGLVLASLGSVLGASQEPFGLHALSLNHHAHSVHNDSIGVQELHLSSVTGSAAYTVLSHERFPNHRVRIKKTHFCDPTVNVYTGYLDVDQGAKHLFFYFFESRRDPDNDDVVMWINGGPGCSSSMGLLMELDYGETVGTTEEAAQNVHAFISIFFETFTQFKGRPLHLSGESYGGRYLPVFASEIYDQNQAAKAEGRPVLNLQSVLIGNGITDISTLYSGRYEIECGLEALDVPFQSISTCVRMKQALPRCNVAMDRYCVEVFDEMSCRAAINFCNSELSTGYWASGRNVYDISKMCLGDSLCYLENSVIKDFLDQPAVRTVLGVETPSNFSACSHVVGQEFDLHMDKYAVPTQYYVAGLLDRGIRVLIYAGTYDWQCNWFANKLWVDKLEWSGQAGYASAAWRDWSVALNGTKAGETKAYGNLTFATVRGAGHMMSAFDFSVHRALG